MLGKLIKNSFKANASAVYNVYIAMGIIGVIMLVTLLFDWTKWGDTGIGLGLVIKIIASSALCITAAIGTIMTIVAVVSEFNRNMYGNEGYLTMTLPVKSSTLLMSKWISGSVWVCISYFMLIACAFLSFIYCVRHSMSVVEGNEAYLGVAEMLKEIIAEICASSGIVTPSMSVLLNLALMYSFEGGIRIWVFVLLLFFAITMSHCRPYGKLGKPGKVIWFFGGTFAIAVFAAIVTKLIKIYIVISDTHFTFTLSQNEVAAAWKLGFGAYSVTNIYCTIIASILLFLITTSLIEGKVNTD